MTRERLTLCPAPSGDAGRGLVRLAPAALHALGLRPGDTVSVHGTRTTHARVLPQGAAAPHMEEAVARSPDAHTPCGKDVTLDNLDPSTHDATEVARGAHDGLAADPIVAENAGARWGAAVHIMPADLPVLSHARLEADGSVDLTRLAPALQDVALTEGDNLTVPSALDGKFRVVSLTPGPAGRVTQSTRFELAPPPLPDLPGVAGLRSQRAELYDMVELPLSRPDLFDRIGLTPPRGVLFTGPPGSGKTLAARGLAERRGTAFFHVSGPEIVSKHYGESERALRGLFEAAAARAPAIVFIDEIDAIAPRRDSLSGEKQVERRVVAQLLTLLDGLSPRDRVIAIAATNLPDALDPALRRPGRFDREIVFGAPGSAERAEILGLHLARAPLAPQADLQTIAARAHGYVGADLAALAREAGLAALARARGVVGAAAQLQADDVTIDQADLEAGFARTRPSALREDEADSVPPLWSDIGGLDTVKATLTEAVIWPLTRPDALAQLRLSAPRGILLAGPPGTGKTLLARALAAESGMNFVPVRPARLLSQFLGEPERGIEALFRRARLTAPSLLFFDEIDTLAPRRGRADPAVDRVIAQLLTEMDGLTLNSDVVILGATNRASEIDPALTRPGRFDLVVSVPLPDADARAEVLAVHCRGRPLADDVDLTAIAGVMDGAAPAHLAALVTSAARLALARALKRGADPATPLAISQADLATAARSIEARSHRLDPPDPDKEGRPF